MDKRILIFLFALTTPVYPLPNGLRSLLPDLHKEYAYVLKTNVSIGAVPHETGSYWTLKGRLVAQAFDNYTRVRFRLDHLKTSIYSKNNGYSSYQYEEAVEHLSKPWEVDYQENGLLYSMHIGAEPVWATNIKRALSLNFQLTKGSGTFMHREPCLYTNCMVVYVEKGQKIEKYSTVQISSAAAERSWSSIPWTPQYLTRNVPDAISTAERVYHLDDRKGLVSLDLKGDFQYKIQDQILFVLSELFLYYHNETPNTIDKLNLVQTNLQYDANDYGDFNNNILSYSQGELKNKTLEILLKITRKGIDADNIVRNASMIHSLAFIELLDTVALLDYNSLSKLFEDLVLSTSYDLETSRNIFLEVLPHARTDPSARFIKHLLLEEKEKVEDAALLSLIRKLPFNIANSSQNLLEDLEAFTKLGPDFSQEIRHAAILSFATLVHKTMELRILKQDYFDDIIIKYFRMYSDCPQYIDRLIWLQGLGNLGYSAKGYSRIIFGDTSRDRHERLWAALTLNQNQVLETALPILMNDTEHIQLRIGILHTLLSSDIGTNNLMFIHNYVQHCNNKQLKKFWYATVKNLDANMLYNGYAAASSSVPFIVNQVESVDSTYWATTNHITSVQDDTGSAHLQVLSVGEPMGPLPEFVGFKLATGGRRPYNLEVYFIVEGVSYNIFNQIHKIKVGEEDLGYQNVLEILKSIKLDNVKLPEEVHIDLVIKVHDKTVYATHLNKSKFESCQENEFAVWKSLEDFLRFGSHINQQIVYYPYQMYANIPTDLGTPISLQSTVASFASIRGNLIAEKKKSSQITSWEDLLSWIFDIHIRYQATAVTALSTDGPLLQSKHSARTQQSLVAHLPIKCNVSLGLSGKTSMTFSNVTNQNAGVAMHSRIQIATKSPRGADVYSVSTEKTEDQEDDGGVFFDCKQPMSGDEILERLTTARNVYELATTLQPTAVFLNIIRLVNSPPPSPCGLLIPSQNPHSNNDTCLSVQFQGLDVAAESDDNAGNIKFLTTVEKFILDAAHERHYIYKVDAVTKLVYKYKGPDERAALAVEVHGTNIHSDDGWEMNFTIDKHTQNLSEQLSIYPSIMEGSINFTYANTCKPHDICNTTTIEAEYRSVPQVVSEGKFETHFDMNITGENLQNLPFKLDQTRNCAAFNKKLNINTNSLDAHIEIKNNGISSLRINRGSEIKMKSDTFAWLLNNLSYLQILRKYGFYRECRIQESIVKTIKGTTERLPDTRCSTVLALADCSEKPRFAVTRDRDGSVKFHLDNKVVLYESGNESKIIFRGHEDEDVEESESMFTELQIVQSFNETIILMPYFYKHTVCGACIGEFDYNNC